MTQHSLSPELEESPKEWEYILDDGTPLDEGMSALQKAVRRGDEEMSLYFGWLILQKYHNVFWKRILTIASEDVGNADPNAAILCHALHENYSFIKEKSKYSSGNVFAMQALIYLIRCKKNRETDNVLPHIRQKLEDGWKIEVPDWALDCHTKRGKRMGRTKGDFFGEGCVLENEDGLDKYKGQFDPSRV